MVSVPKIKKTPEWVDTIFGIKSKDDVVPHVSTLEQPAVDITETTKFFTKADDTKPIIKEYKIKPKDKAFIDFFSQEGLDYTAPQTFAKQLIEAGTYAKSDRKQWWLNALTQAKKSAKEYPDHPASIKYNKLTEEAIRQSGKTTAENLTLAQKQAGQVASVEVQRLNRVKKYENLKRSLDGFTIESKKHVVLKS